MWRNIHVAFFHFGCMKKFQRNGAQRELLRRGDVEIVGIKNHAAVAPSAPANVELRR
jgi:hypothetical protein